MKKIAVLILMAVMLTGCDDVEITTYEPSVSPTPERFNLIEDGETGILYIDNEVRTGNAQHRYSIYTPYYSENGKLCKLNDGKIVEVEE